MKGHLKRILESSLDRVTPLGGFPEIPLGVSPGMSFLERVARGASGDIPKKHLEEIPNVLWEFPEKLPKKIIKQLAQFLKGLFWKSLLRLLKESLDEPSNTW